MKKNSIISKGLLSAAMLVILLITGCKDDSVIETNNNGNNQEPNSPQLTEPVNNSVIPVSDPVLKWNEYPNTLSYKIHISKDANFISTLIKDTIVNTTEVRVNPGLLATNINYYWRVMAMQNGNNSEWSAVWRFNLILAPPPPPELLLPINNSTSQPFLPLFDWNDPFTAESYRLQISTGSGFATILFDSTNINVSQLQCPPMYLNTNTQYFWRVRASNSNGISIGDWSLPFNFTTVDGPEPNSISGTITFADQNFISGPNFYVASAYTQTTWPPQIAPPISIDSLSITQNNGVYTAAYKLSRIPNGNYIVSSQIFQRSLLPIGVYGTYGCDTARVLFSPCAFTPKQVTISGNNGVTGINFLSWADSTMQIFNQQR